MSESEDGASRGRRARSKSGEKRKPKAVHVETDGSSTPAPHEVSPLSDTEDNRKAMEALAHRRKHPDQPAPFTPPSPLSPPAPPDNIAIPRGRSSVQIAEPRVGCWSSFKRWRVWQYLFKYLPYGMAAAQVVLMICIGLSGSQIVPLEWRWYFAQVGQYRLGAMGYCDDMTGTCRQAIFYNLSHPKTSTWSNTMIFCALLLLIAVGAFLALTSYVLLAFRALASAKWEGASGFDCCALSFSRCYPAEKPQERLAGWWFERTMFFVLFWTLLFGGLTMFWESSADAEGLAGDGMLTALMIISGAWLPLYWVYNSSWDRVHRAPRIRKTRHVIRGHQAA